MATKFTNCDGFFFSDADMTSATMQSNKIIASEVKGN